MRYVSDSGEVVYDDEGFRFDSGELSPSPFRGSFGTVYRIRRADGSDTGRALKVFTSGYFEEDLERFKEHELAALEALGGANGHAPRVFGGGRFFFDEELSPDGSAQLREASGPHQDGPGSRQGGPGPHRDGSAFLQDGSIVYRGEPVSYPAFEMEFIEGQTLEYALRNRTLKNGAIKEGRRLDGMSTLELVLAICKAVGECHGANGGKPHRDLKPDNLILKLDDGAHGETVVGNVVVVDWGQTPTCGNATQALKGSILFSSPEVLRSEPIDRPPGRKLPQERVTTDVWSLGVIACFIRTAKLPDLPGDVGEAVEHLREHPVANDLLKALEEHHGSSFDVHDKLLWEFVRKCTRFQPEDRFASVGIAIEFLEDCLGGRRRPTEPFEEIVREAPSMRLLPDEGQDKLRHQPSETIEEDADLPKRKRTAVAKWIPGAVAAVALCAAIGIGVLVSTALPTLEDDGSSGSYGADSEAAGTDSAADAGADSGTVAGTGTGAGAANTEEDSEPSLDDIDYHETDAYGWELLPYSMSAYDEERERATGLQDAVSLPFSSQNPDEALEELRKEVLCNPIFGIGLGEMVQAIDVEGATFGGSNPWIDEAIEACEGDAVDHWTEHGPLTGIEYVTTEYRTYAVALCRIFNLTFSPGFIECHNVRQWTLDDSLPDSERKLALSDELFSGTALVFEFTRANGESAFQIGFSAADKRPLLIQG